MYDEPAPRTVMLLFWLLLAACSIFLLPFGLVMNMLGPFWPLPSLR